MTIPAGAIECPRGHQREPLTLVVRSRSGRELDPASGADYVLVPVWSRRDLDRRLAEIEQDPDLEAYLRPAELPSGQESTETDTGGEDDDMPTDTLPAPRGGDSYTHGQWQQAIGSIDRALAQLPPALENMLASLSTVDAGKTQVTGVMTLYDRTAAWAEKVKNAIRDVDARAVPVVDAVSAAGGPDDINNIRYYEEV
jgi:hypothetical protein